MSRKRHTLGSFPVAFLDLFLGALGLYITYVMMLSIMVRQEREQVESAGYVEGVYRVTAQWPGHLEDDVDLYVRDPHGHIAYFRAQSQGLMHLEHDDLGSRNDFFDTVNGPVVLQENIEHTIIRGTIPGEYIVNVHLYHMAGGDPVSVTVTLRKSATGEVIVERQVILARQGAEQTPFRFAIDAQGVVTGINQLPFVIVPPAEQQIAPPFPIPGGRLF